MPVVAWASQTWDEWDGSSQPDVFVLGLEGIEDIEAAAAALAGGGQDGAAVSQATLSPLGFTARLLVLADDNDDMAAKLDDLKPAIQPDATESRQTAPFVYTIDGQDARSVFARVLKRSIGTIFDAEDRMRACEILVQYEVPDPMTYGAEGMFEFEAPGTHAWTGEGWAWSKRWTLEVYGPASNIELTHPALPAATARYTGPTIPDGDVLVIRRAGPHALVTKQTAVESIDDVETIGHSVYRYFDGGEFGAGRPPQWLEVGPGSQSVHVDWDGAGTAIFRWREAKP